MIFTCMNTGRRVGENDKTIYYADFVSLPERGENGGNLSLVSYDEIHYKPHKKYKLTITEDSGIALVK